METKDISDELWREYTWGNGEFTYRIREPQKLAVGRTTHRVIDSEGIVHCVPAVGFHGCVLRWNPRDNNAPIAF